MLLKHIVAVPFPQETHGHNALTNDATRLGVILPQTWERHQLLRVNHFKIRSQPDGGVINNVTRYAA